jgi:hypothetical protein
MSRILQLELQLNVYRVECRTTNAIVLVNAFAQISCCHVLSIVYDP